MPATKLIIEAPLSEKRVLLHACCAPCSSAIVEVLLQNGIVPTIFYSNSNITPRREYDIRYNECLRYAQSLGVELVCDEYDHEAWLSAVKGMENFPERGPRCLECFKFRLLRAADYAARHDFKVLTTTLASSRWKSLQQVNEAGTFACAQTNTSLPPERQLIWWDRNWRKDGLQERRGEIIREMNFYNQLFCGCEYTVPPPRLAV